MSSILYASYNKNINTVEMKRKFNAHLVGKGYLEGFDLEFRGFPSITPSLGKRVPVAIWQLSGKSQTRLDYDEFMNIGDYTKEYLSIKLEAYTEQVIKDGIHRDEIKALVYISKESEPLAQLSLVDYNILFEAYQTHGFDPAILVRAALAANTQYEERERAKFEQHGKLMAELGLNEEEVQILYYNLIAKSLLNIKKVDSSSYL
ncbi:hypothetical protein [Cohnella yongneupensis]|uniref:Uncharacterized protein n=1 Tax=Cohnella yongneupensis TaxID=425006 RepID=A0ABW0QTT2_9BACL